MILTTSSGVCRSCHMTWPVRRTRIAENMIRRDPLSGACFFPQLPRRCPRCGSVQISYPYDQKLLKKKRVDST